MRKGINAKKHTGKKYIFFNDPRYYQLGNHLEAG